jgi:hypothetical protein
MGKAGPLNEFLSQMVITKPITYDKKIEMVMPGYVTEVV